MKMAKRSFAILMALCMMLSLLPFAAFAEDAETPAAVTVYEGTNVKLRQNGDKATGYIRFENVTEDWVSAIESITLTPVNADGSAVDTAGASYPNAPKEYTLTKDGYGDKDAEDTKWYVKDNYIYFYRTAEEPVVYVMADHEPLDVTSRWGTVTYPQSQVYNVTVKAEGYDDVTGSVTYYTGTSSTFSIIVVEEDGTENVVKEFTYEELAELSTFANGSSQCGMTGFRSFSTNGVSLTELLKIANVEVSESDYFLLDTSDHYGNNFTYESLFGTTRYFLDSIYADEEVATTYAELVKSDDEAGATLELRQLLARKALAAGSTIEPRICISYNETMIYGDQVGTLEIPTAENTTFNSLVSYENQYRFVYGIAIEDTATVTFDTGDGSKVASQTISVDPLTSTENTTIKSSYWANALVIYRGKGTEYITEDVTPVEAITEPEAPTREGYTFGGWYTDAACTDGNEFDFTAPVQANSTVYAKWIPGNPFTDVAESDYFYAPALWANEKGITNGYGNASTFAPSVGCSRAQVVTFLWRAAGEPAPTVENTFTDISENDYFYNAVLWALEKGITNGWGSEEIFNPEGVCTRGQVVTFLWRYQNQPEVTAENVFTDVAEDAFYFNAVLWALENEVTTGKTATTFDPETDCTRGEIVTFLYRALAE